MPPTPPPEYFGLPADAWNAIAAWITAGTAIVVAFAAWRAWKKQVARDHFIDIARGLMRAAVELQYEIDHFRSDAFAIIERWNNELDKHPDHCKDYVARDVGRAMLPLLSKFAALDVVYREAQVVFTDIQLQPARQLLRLRLMFEQRLTELVQYFSPESREAMEPKLAGILEYFRKVPADDPLSIKVERYLVHLTGIVRKYSQK